MQLVETRVLDDASIYPEFDRGAEFLGRLRALGVDITDKDIADLGAGYGSISIAAAKAGARSVAAVDANPDRINVIRERVSGEDLRVDAQVGNLLQPLEHVTHKDLALLIGVVEYAGLWDTTQSVVDLQTRVLSTTFEALRPGGELVFATKNRLWPLFVVKDIHTGQPLVNALPRTLADSFSQKISGKPYREHIHSPEKWVSLVQSVGFSDVTPYYPYFNYQYPMDIVERPDLRRYAALEKGGIPPSLHRLAMGRFQTLKALLMSLSSRLGHPMTQSVIILARKPLHS